ncbi:hypothetical protein HPP92_007570 [Vanilla planifolia]|uniref:Large ribosomal subunit protein bL17c n=1 Tax=Vanilla planifolia TaxID=51239 RepID=A0A835RGX3_VANPL|nr:hypothetical protein HPP92_007570 [Vanilla planifolia]
MALVVSSTAASAATPWNLTSLRAALPSVSCNRITSIRFPRYSHCTGPGNRTAEVSMQKTMPFFSGLTPMARLLHIFPDDSYENRFPVIENGRRYSAMRHGKRVPKLNRPPDQRRALIRGLTTQLLKHGRIKTTRARAKGIRKYVDKMITLAKDGSLHKRRQALGFIYEKQIVHALFAEVQGRYGERNGGYTRIIRTLPRRGDNAPMAYIELV